MEEGGSGGRRSGRSPLSAARLRHASLEGIHAGACLPRTPSPSPLPHPPFSFSHVLHCVPIE